MTVLLHVVATPDTAESRTLRISEALIAAHREPEPSLDVQTLKLFAQDIPVAAGTNIAGRLANKPAAGDPLASSWSYLRQLVDQFLGADVVVISTPMWNFSVSYALKYYIDTIVQPGLLYTFDDNGRPQGKCAGKRLICVTTRGGDYSEGSPMREFDFQEPYLRAVFGLVGITHIRFITGQPMDLAPEARDAALNKAIDEARSLFTG